MNVGCYVNGNPPKSKKAVKEALASAPHTVRFFCTDVFSNRGRSFSGAEIPADAGKLTLVGPCPYKARKFYGTIVREANGKIKVT